MQTLFTLSHDRTRDRSNTLEGNQFKTDKRKYLFTQNTLNLWNALPQRIIKAKSLTEFKIVSDVLIHNKNRHSYIRQDNKNYIRNRPSDFGA